MKTVEDLVAAFVSDIRAAFAAELMAKLSNSAVNVSGTTAKISRPKQLCPVPGCKNPAAPLFGMVCKVHKDLPKSQIKKFREQRKRLQKPQ